MEHQVIFQKLPLSLAEMEAEKASRPASAELTAGFTIAALCLYRKDRDECFRMLDTLRGPRPLSVMEKQFIDDRFMDGCEYVPFSFFHGAVPENGYTPDHPYILTFQDAAVPVAEEGWSRLYIHSSGADHPRPITLRYKPSADEWFLWEMNLLSQIRKPADEDPWR